MKGREVYRELDDKLLSQEETRMVREIQIQKLIDDNKIWKSKKIEEFKESVDFPVLINIFEELYQRAGKDPKEMNIVPPQDIYAYRGDSTKAAYHVGINIITINPEHENSELSQEEWSIEALRGLVHEETHAFAKTISIESYKGGKPGQETVHATEDIISGFEKSRFLKTLKEGENILTEEVLKSFSSFNEGITELIAERVLKEYLHRTGQSGRTPKRTYYKEPKMFARQLFQRIAASTDVPEKEVENAFIVAYTEGSFGDPETIQDLENITFPNFLRAIGALKGDITDATAFKILTGWLATNNTPEKA